MSDAPERISLELRQGMADDFWSECRDPRYAKSEPVAYVRADRLEAQEALLKEAMAALLFYADEQYDGYNVCITDYGLSTENGPIITDGGKQASATLAKLREHLEDKP